MNKELQAKLDKLTPEQLAKVVNLAARRVAINAMKKVSAKATATPKP